MNNSQPERQERLAPHFEDHLPNGPAGAAILSAGVGCCVLGILAVVADACKSAAGVLTFYPPTGPLSGVSSTAILLWLITWYLLARRWRTKTVAIVKINATAFLLLALGILLTFPPFADFLQRR